MSRTPQEAALLHFWEASAREWRRRSHLAAEAKGDEPARRVYRRLRSPRPLPRSTRPVTRQAARSSSKQRTKGDRPALP
jgi:hypothetical protein